MIALVLTPKPGTNIEWHPLQVGKRMYPYRDGNLVAFWRSLEDARAELPQSPLLAPLTELFEVGLWPMARIEQELAGKHLLKVDMQHEPPFFPFDLVFALSAEEAQRLAADHAASMTR